VELTVHAEAPRWLHLHAHTVLFVVNDGAVRTAATDGPRCRRIANLKASVVRFIFAGLEGKTCGARHRDPVGRELFAVRFVPTVLDPVHLQVVVDTWGSGKEQTRSH
jgi:hypothetical protein